MSNEDNETREEIEEAIGHLTYAAKRCFPRVGTPEFPTKWDERHEQIDAQLDARDRLAVLV